MKLKRRFSSDAMLVIGIVAVLGGLIAASAYVQGRLEGDQPPPYASSSAARNGARGLMVWLESLGYAAHPRTEPLTALDSDTRALIVLPGKRLLSSDEVDRIMSWVAEGNTLVYATAESGADAFGNDSSGDGQDPLLSELDVRLATSAFDTPMRMPQPVIVGSNVPTEVVFSNAALATTRNGMVPLLTRGSATQAMLIPYGDGHIFLSSAPGMFTNGGLDLDTAWGATYADLIHGMLNGLGAGARIDYDETLRNAAVDEQPSLMRKLYTTPWGLGFLYSLLLLLAVLGLNGRRFGRPQPLPRELIRRSPGEYVESMARLFRRGDKRQAMLNHYRHQLKLRLGKANGVDAALGAEAFVAELTRVRGEANFDSQALRATLGALAAAGRGASSEAELVKSVNAAQQLLAPGLTLPKSQKVNLKE